MPSGNRVPGPHLSRSTFTVTVSYIEILPLQSLPHLIFYDITLCEPVFSSITSSVTSLRSLLSYGWCRTYIASGWLDECDPWLGLQPQSLALGFAYCFTGHCRQHPSLICLPGFSHVSRWGGCVRVVCLRVTVAWMYMNLREPQLLIPEDTGSRDIASDFLVGGEITTSIGCY